jgi:oligopeptide transport system substrate-binding protein
MRSIRKSAAARSTAAAGLLLLGALAVLAVASGARRDRADFAFASGGEPSTLDPHAASGVTEGRVIAALYEGLCGRDPVTAAPVPGAAESWTVSADGLTCTFRLRADARWSNGDPLLASDYEWSFRRLLDPATGSPYTTALWCVAGAREFTTGRDAEGREVAREWSRVGIRALDERTLEIRLREPAAHLFDLLACPQLVPLHRPSLEAARSAAPASWTAAWTRPGKLVTNGPFALAERRVNDRLRLVRNAAYWDAANVAFATVDVLAVESWTTALNLYLTGELDWVDGAIPTELVPALLERDDFLPAPYLGVYFYRLNTTRPPLDDSRVRRALSLALRREEICTRILKAGQEPAVSFVPWGGVGTYVAPKTIVENAARARELIAEAGYGPENPFPRLVIHYNTSEVHRDVAEVIAAQWKSALGIEVGLANQEWKTFLDAQRRLDYDVSRSSWIADYPDAATFLEIWTTNSENNRTGWSSERFDAFLARARAARDAAQRNALLSQAEQVFAGELPAIPIYWYVSQNLVTPRLGGFAPNPLNAISPKAWRWRTDEETAAAIAAARKLRPAAAPPRPKK